MENKRIGERVPAAPSEHRVVVLGASPKPARYSNMAVHLLKNYGYQVIPVHPKVQTIAGLVVVPNLRSIHETIHTMTLYVGPAHGHVLLDDIVYLNPRRVIFNPGSESLQMQKVLHRHHIRNFSACTLVLLRTGQF